MPSPLAPTSVISRPPTTQLGDIMTWRGDGSQVRDDVLAVEEPLEIRLAGCRVAVTMRTPGDDFDLALGFLFTEGIITAPADVASLAHCPTEEVDAAGNIVNVNPSDPALVQPERWQRNFYTTSSCGVCGKSSIAAIWQDAPPIPQEGGSDISFAALTRLEAELRRAQATFGRTGGLHAAGLFDGEGRLRVSREDVGRHNAVDKVIGHALQRDELPLREGVLLVSGRASFEIMQKALMAGIPVVAAVSAPSSLAVELARAANMTLIGFLRGGQFNVYAGAERVAGG